MVVVWAGWLKRLEEERLSLSAGGSQSRLTAAEPGVGGREGAGPLAFVFGGRVWGERVFAGDGGESSAADLSVTAVGGGALTEGLDDD